MQLLSIEYIYAYFLYFSSLGAIPIYILSFVNCIPSISNSTESSFKASVISFISPYTIPPEKSFKSFSLLANALPIGIPAEGLDLGILQPEIGILQPDRCSSDSQGFDFPEGYFPAETFHNAYPSAGMPTGRVFAEWLKDLKEK